MFTQRSILWIVLSCLILSSCSFLNLFTETAQNAWIDGNWISISPAKPCSISAIHFKEGDLVKKGNLLIELDSTEAAAALTSAQNHLEETIKQVCQLFKQAICYRSEITNRKSELNKLLQDLQHHESELTYAQLILKTHIRSLQILHHLYENTAAKIQGTSIKNHPLILAALSQEQNARLQYNACKIYSPADAFIHRIGGNSLLQLVPCNQIWVNATFTKKQIKRLHIGQIVELFSPRYGKDLTFKGTITELTEAKPVRIELSTAELQLHPLKIGDSLLAKVSLLDHTLPSPASTFTSTSPPHQDPLHIEPLLADHLDPAIAFYVDNPLALSKLELVIPSEIEEFLQRTPPPPVEKQPEITSREELPPPAAQTEIIDKQPETLATPREELPPPVAKTEIVEKQPELPPPIALDLPAKTEPIEKQPETLKIVREKLPSPVAKELPAKTEIAERQPETLTTSREEPPPSIIAEPQPETLTTAREELPPLPPCEEPPPCPSCCEEPPPCPPCCLEPLPPPCCGESAPLCLDPFCCEDSWRPSGIWPKRITLRHIEGTGGQSGISYGTDYTTLALLYAPDYRPGHLMPLLDLRGHRFDNNTWAANVGIGGRYIPCPNFFCELWGLNVFYDFRQGFKGNYHQVGVGLEILGSRWDFRANGYVPLGEASNMTCCVANYLGGYFIEHTDCEYATYGFNAEIGWLPIRTCNFLVYLAGGPYYLTRKSFCFEPLRGVKGRIRPQYKDYFAVDCSISYDNVYKTVYQTAFILYLPLYRLSCTRNQGPCCITDRQIYQPIERFEIMPLGRRNCWQYNF